MSWIRGKMGAKQTAAMTQQKEEEQNYAKRKNV
jgi:hypothetical protein